MWFRSVVAVAVVKAGSSSPNLPPSPATPICHRYSPKKKKKKKKKEKKRREHTGIPSSMTH